AGIRDRNVTGVQTWALPLYAGAGDVPDGVEGDGAAGLDDRAPGDLPHPGGEVGEREVVEHEDVDAAGEHGLDLVEAVHLHLEPGGVAEPGAGPADRLGEVHALLGEHGEMVVLGHHGVGEGEAVVHAPAAAHRVPFEGAQARGGLAGVGDARARALDGVDHGPGGG